MLNKGDYSEIRDSWAPLQINTAVDKLNISLRLSFPSLVRIKHKNPISACFDVDPCGTCRCEQEKKVSPVIVSATAHKAVVHRARSLCSRSLLRRKSTANVDRSVAIDRSPLHKISSDCRVLILSKS